MTNQPNSSAIEHEEMECNRCGGELVQDQKFCSDCGVEMLWPETPLRNLTTSQSEEIECDQCGGELVQNQKFCGSCGVEKVWPDTPKYTVRQASSHIDESYIPQSNKGRDIAIAIVVGVLLLIFAISFLRPSSSLTDFEQCMLERSALHNGNLSQNIVKKMFDESICRS